MRLTAYSQARPQACRSFPTAAMVAIVASGGLGCLEIEGPRVNGNAAYAGRTWRYPSRPGGPCYPCCASFQSTKNDRDGKQRWFREG